MTKFTLTYRDEKLAELVSKTDHKILAIWARDCTLRVLPFFEEKFPNDSRPKEALKVLNKWVQTGEFSMKVIRKASLDAHAAARDVGEDSSARSAARAAGQSVATAHVRTHSMGGSLYALQAIYRNSLPKEADKKVAAELNWQYQHLIDLNEANLRG